MADIRRAFHPEFHILGSHTEFVFQNSARPERRGLLVFRHADALAGKIFAFTFAFQQDQ